MTLPEDAPICEKAKSPFTRSLPLMIIGLGIALFFAFDLNHFLTFENLRDHRVALLEWYAQNRVLSVIGFIGIYVLVVAFSVPGASWMSLGAGFLFGTLMATIYVVVAATLGAVAIFLVARYALADFFRAKTGAMSRKMEAGFKENALSYLLVLRLVPLFPFWLVNLVPAFLGVPTRTFIIGTFFGIIPGTAVFCSVGNGLGAVFEAGEVPNLGIIFEPQILMPILALAALSIVPVIYKKLKPGR